MSTLKAGRPSNKEKAISMVQDNDIETVRMNINLPKSFYKQVKQKALDEDATITEIIKKAVSTYLHI